MSEKVLICHVDVELIHANSRTTRILNLLLYLSILCEMDISSTTCLQSLISKLKMSIHI